MTLHEFPGRVMFSITRPHASRENFGRLPSGVPCRNIFSRRSRKDRHEGSWIQVRISRFVPCCRSYEWMAHVRKRGTWPLLTRTLWVVFHGTPIFKSLGVGFECFGVPKYLRCYLAARDAFLRGSSQIFALVSLLIIYSRKSIASGMLCSVEASRI